MFCCLANTRHPQPSKIQEHSVATRKNLNQKKRGDHYNPGNMSGKTVSTHKDGLRPTKRVQTQSNGATISIQATCQERQSAPPRMSLSNPTLIGWVAVRSDNIKKPFIANE